MKILVVEDDPDISELVAYNLTKHAFDVRVESDGQKAVDACLEQHFDLILLDLMLPVLDGIEICKILRANPKTQKVPILILSAKGDEIDKVVAFEMGVDDYLTKPFSPRELVLRVKAILKRSSQHENLKTQQINFGCLHLDVDRFYAEVHEEEVKLTAIEFKLLTYLFEKRGRVLSRDILLDQVWGYQVAVTTRTVDTHVKRLRAKLKAAGDYIETVRGIGYRFKEKC